MHPALQRTQSHAENVTLKPLGNLKLSHVDNTRITSELLEKPMDSSGCTGSKTVSSSSTVAPIKQCSYVQLATNLKMNIAVLAFQIRKHMQIVHGVLHARTVASLRENFQLYSQPVAYIYTVIRNYWTL